MKLEYISFFVGAGFPDESVANAEARSLDFVGADAGTIDVGPYQLAGAGTIFSEALCRHDLRRALTLARAKNIPLVIGSCGGAGTDWGVDWFAGMVRDAAREARLPGFKMARLYSEPDRDYLRQKIRAKRVRALGGAKFAYTEEAVTRSTRIVGVMGAEPVISALEQGADVVLAGRMTDSAIFSAIPLMKGFAASVSWHAGKVAECGGAIAEPARNDLLHVAMTLENFVVTPMTQTSHCTPWSVSAHQLYENADPFVFVEPSGTLDATHAKFAPVGERSVKISGASFAPASGYTMKLEGVEPAGFQSIAMAAYNDPVLIAELPVWLERVRTEIGMKSKRVFGEAADAARLTIHTYGAGSAPDLFGLKPIAPAGSDVFFLVEVTAPDQEMATSVATLAWHTLIHFPPSGWSGSFVNAAWPFNPPVIERGMVHRFNVNHVIELDDPLENVRFAYEEVGR